MKNDIFKARGDVFNARGDVFSAQGDVFHAKGDVFGAEFYKATALSGKTDEEVMSLWRSGQVSDADYYAWLDSQEESEAKKDGSGVFAITNNILGFADKAVDIKNKFESGQSTEKSGVEYTANLGTEEVKKDNTIWYIAGGVLVLLIVVGVVMARKK